MSVNRTRSIGTAGAAGARCPECGNVSQEQLDFPISGKLDDYQRDLDSMCIVGEHDQVFLHLE